MIYLDGSLNEYWSPESLSWAIMSAWVCVCVCMREGLTCHFVTVSRLRGEQSVVCWRALLPMRDSGWMMTAASQRERKKKRRRRRNQSQWAVHYRVRYIQTDMHNDVTFACNWKPVGTGYACGKRRMPSYLNLSLSQPALPNCILTKEILRDGLKVLISKEDELLYAAYLHTLDIPDM